VLVGWALSPAGYEGSVEELRLPIVDDVVWHLCPPGDKAQSGLVDLVRSYFTWVVNRHGTSYPVAQQVALELTRRLRDEIDPGDGP
jgi:hypothetical protein